MRRLSRISIATFLFAFAVVSCEMNNSEGFQLVSTLPSESGTAVEYPFFAEFTDTSAVYSTYVIARLNPEYLKEKFVTIEFTLTSPDGRHWAEQMDFPLNKIGDLVTARISTGRCLDVNWPYRSNITVGRSGAAAGRWRIDLRPVNCPEQALLGLGFHYKEENGKR